MQEHKSHDLIRLTFRQRSQPFITTSPAETAMMSAFLIIWTKSWTAGALHQGSMFLSLHFMIVRVILRSRLASIMARGRLCASTV